MAAANRSEEENPLNPFYLHPNKNPGLVLMLVFLNGNNFHTWFRSMRMSLISKNKLKFVDGRISVPAQEDPNYAAWERCNTMVVSWIIKSLSPTIAQSVIWIDSACDLWKDLYDRFSQGDAVRIADLQEELASLK